MGSLVSREGRLRRTAGGTTAVLLCLLALSVLPANAESVGEIAPAAAAQVPAITYPVDGAIFYDLPSVGGTGEAGSTVTIADGSGTVICSVPVDDLGNFFCDGTQLLPGGSSSLTITATSADGTATSGNTVQVLAEYAIGVSYPESGSLISSEQRFSGRARPDVEVQMVTGAGMPVCTTMSDSWGDYECIPTVPFPVGPLTLAPSMTVVEGSVVVGDSVGWTVIAEPVITSPTNGSITGDRPVFSGTGYPGSDINIVHGRSGATMCTAKTEADGTFSCLMDRPLMVGSLEVFPSTSAHGVGSVMGKMITIAVEVSPTILRPAQGDVVSESPVIEGTAGARSNVAIEDEHGTTVCSTVADEMGNFGCAVMDAALTPGAHTLTPVQTSFAGIVVRGATVSVTVPGTVPGVTPSATPSPSTTAAPTNPSTTATTPAPSVTSSKAALHQGSTRVLAVTGANGIVPLIVVAGLLLLLGGAAVLLTFRRRTREH